MLHVMRINKQLTWCQPSITFWLECLHCAAEAEYVKQVQPMLAVALVAWNEQVYIESQATGMSAGPILR